LSTCEAGRPYFNRIALADGLSFQVVVALGEVDLHHEKAIPLTFHADGRSNVGCEPFQRQ
jgi:hypothetical protein